jgi:toxin ParE1/3/4
MFPIIWSFSAQRDLATIDLHYLSVNPDYADRIGRAALNAATFLATNPMAGPAVEGTDVRKWIVRVTPYLIFYRLDGKRLRIVRIRHMAQDWKPAVP